MVIKGTFEIETGLTLESAKENVMLDIDTISLLLRKSHEEIKDESGITDTTMKLIAEKGLVELFQHAYSTIKATANVESIE